MIEFNHKKAVQALNYFASITGGNMNKMKALKLIWLSDRLHLRKYARPIIGDEYFAFKLGPVASGVRDILESNSFLGTGLSYSKEYISLVGKYSYRSIKEVNFKVFSKTDVEVLKTIFDTYGNVEPFGLSEFSHFFPEWQKFEDKLKSNQSSRYKMSYEDFFINVQDQFGLFSDEANVVELSKEIFMEASNL